MTKSNATKRALLVSALAVVMCLAMLIGTTFAWFTDTASTGLNKIQAGNLDVKLSYKDGDTFKEVSSETKVLGNNGLWEPGHVEYAVLKVSNAGTLALKYKLGINIAREVVSESVEDTELRLSEFIKFAVLDGEVTGTRSELVTAAEAKAEKISNGYTSEEDRLLKGEEKVVTLVVWMPENVGNSANYKNGAVVPEIDLGINVVATQDTHEKDSFDETYDEGATYPILATVNTVEEFNNALEFVKKGSGSDSNSVKIKLNNDLNDANGIQTDADKTLAVDFNNKTIRIDQATGSLTPKTCGAQFLKGSTVTLENGTYINAATGSTGGYLLVQNYSNLTLNNMNLDGTSGDVKYVLSSNCGDVLIKGNTNITAADGTIALDIMHWECTSYIKEGTHVVFDETMTGTVDGKIEVYCYDDASKKIRPVDDGGATLIIKGGTFVNTGLTLEQFKAFVPSGYTVTNVTNGYKVTKG